MLGKLSQKQINYQAVSQIEKKTPSLLVRAECILWEISGNICLLQPPSHQGAQDYTSKFRR